MGLCDEWEEDDIIAQVMAQSQQEYLDSLRTKATTSSPAKRSTGSKSTTESRTDSKKQECDQNLNIPSDSANRNSSAGRSNSSNCAMDSS